MRIKWLHLSDIHFNYRNFDSRLLRKDFINRIKKMSESEKFTHLFLTGDIMDKYNPNNDTINETVNFINDLIAAMCIDRQNVFIVPGNHDHNRNITNNIASEIYSNHFDDEKVCEKIRCLTASQVKALLESFEKFSAIYKTIYGSDYYTSSENPHVIINRDNISIIKINTSWLDVNSDSENNLYCDADHLLTLLENNEEVLNQGINIAIGHHPLEGIALQERERILGLLQRYKIGLYFCGHVHRPSIAYYEKNDVLQLACTGGFADGYSEGGYVSGVCDTDNNLYEAEFYNWNNGSWYIESSLDGTNERGICYFNTKRFKHNSNIVAIDFKLFDEHITPDALARSIGCDNFNVILYPFGNIDLAAINWDIQGKNIVDFCKNIKFLIKQNKHVHLYPLAPIPLLIKLGFELQKNSMLSIHQYSRNTGNWVSNERNEEIGFDVLEKYEGNNELIVKISTSSIIDNQLIENTFFESTYDILEFTATKIELGSPLYMTDVLRLVDIIFQYLNKIAMTYDKIHLVAAVPAGMAVEIGRNLLKSLFYNVYTYQLFRGKYCKALIINEDAFVDTTISIDHNITYIEEYQQHIVFVPVVGKIACGEANEPVFETDEYMPMSKSILGSGEYFILKASGDSMIDAGIDNGDLVLIRRQGTADNGQIVVALIEDETTLKRFYRDDKKKQIVLKPENKRYNEKRYKDVRVQGIAVKIIKDL